MAQKAIDPFKWLSDHHPGTSMCSYYIVTDKGVSEHHRDICHARANPATLRFYHPGAKEILSLHSCLPASVQPRLKNQGFKDLTHEMSEMYYNYLFSKERSPYRSIMKGVVVYKDSDGHHLGFSLMDTDVPNALVCSLLIASRLPWEFPEKTYIFTKMVEMGFKDAEAFLISHITSLRGIHKKHLAVDFATGHSTIYGLDYSFEYRKDRDYYSNSIKNIDAGTLNLNGCINGAGSYKYMASSNNWYKIFLGEDRGVIHPFKCKYDDVEKFYYTGKFGRLARQQEDFPLEFEPNEKGEMLLTLEDLLKTRNQWSPLK